MTRTYLISSALGVIFGVALGSIVSACRGQCQDEPTAPASETYTIIEAVDDRFVEGSVSVMPGLDGVNRFLIESADKSIAIQYSYP
jgi:hypothetical protein